MSAEDHKTAIIQALDAAISDMDGMSRDELREVLEEAADHISTTLAGLDCDDKQDALDAETEEHNAGLDG